MNYSIGQKVVCIDSSEWIPFRKPYPIIEGQTYVVQDLSYCNGCGDQVIDVGFYIGGKVGHCKCGCHSLKPSEMWFFNSKRFVPLDEYEKSDKLVSELLTEISNG
jgi:hypothetical protein